MNYQEIVDNSSRQAVLDGMKIIKENNLSNGYFLDPSNSLRFNPNETFDKFSRNEIVIDMDDFKSYLASSTILHCFDGWLYLAHAIEGLLKGDFGVAIHLAYYAELRGCLSFLSSQGISVNAYNHLGISDTKINICSNQEVTHTSAWKFLKNWINSNAIDQSVVLKYIQIRGYSLEELVNKNPYNASSSVAGLFVKDWLKDWSFDLKNYEIDKKVRNLASYVPQRLVTQTHSLKDTIDNILLIWKFIEPNGRDKFNLLDKYLFKSLFEKLHRILPSEHSKITLIDLAAASFESYGMEVDSSLKSIINSRSEHRVIAKSKDFTIDESTGHLNPVSLISRALLMLRLASGSTNYLMKTAGITNSSLDFYLNHVGVNSGHWKEVTPPDFIELWDEISDSINSIGEFIDKPNNLSLYDIYSEYSFDLNNFKQISRACFWGSCI